LTIIMTLRVSPRFILVTGTMRSGTTLMGELLYSRAYGQPCHPALSFANDSFNFLRKLLFGARDQVNPSLHNCYPFGQFVAEEDLLKQTFSAIEGQTLETGTVAQELTRRICEIAPVSGNPHVVGTKSTGITIEFDTIRRLFPQAKMVVLLRDPRDVLASNIKRAGEDRYLFGVAVIANICNYLKFLENRQSDLDILSIRYEDLVEAPYYTVKKVLSFIGLDTKVYDWSSLSENRIMSNSSYIIDRGQTFSLDVGITDQSVGKFYEILSDFEISSVESLLGPLMDAHGYRRCNIDHSSDFEKKYITWLSYVYKGSQSLGQSVEGLRLQMDTVGLGNCVSEFKYRTGIGIQLAIGNDNAWVHINHLLAETPSCNAQRIHIKKVFESVLAYADDRDWNQVENNLKEGVCGEHNPARMFRMCYNLLHHYGRFDALHDYLDWCLANHAQLWRIIIPKRIVLLKLQGDEDAIQRALLEFITHYDEAIADSPDDFSIRIAKVEHILRFGRTPLLSQLQLDVDVILRARADKLLTNALLTRADIIIKKFRE
jgi:hypothetical protein